MKLVSEVMVIAIPALRIVSPIRSAMGRSLTSAAQYKDDEIGERGDGDRHPGIAHRLTHQVSYRQVSHLSYAI